MTLAALPLALEVSDNMDFGELIVGAGTLALAAITGLLAWKTSASVAAAQESAENERASVEAMAMPYVIATPVPSARLNRNEYTGQQLPKEIHRISSDQDNWKLKLCLWNLGSGPGIVESVHLFCDGENVLWNLPQDIPIAARDQFDADIYLADWPTSVQAGILQIYYLHSNGRSYRTESSVTIEENVLTCLTFQRSLAEEDGGG